MSDPFLYDPVKLIITVLVAFIPAIIFTIIIRYSEKFEREPWGSIGQAFMWGGTISIVAVLLIRGFIRIYFEKHYPEIASDAQYMSFIIVCIITPIVAELVKPIGLLFVRADLDEAEDGLIYGLVIGLGFTATENLLFGMFLAPLYGIAMFVGVVIMRSLSVMFIHSGTTALSCYGITRAMKVRHKTGSFFAFPLFLLAAIGIHAAFNYIVFMGMFNFGNIDIIFSISTSLLFSIVFAFVIVSIIYFKIYRLDRGDKDEGVSSDKKEFMPIYDRPSQPRPSRFSQPPPQTRAPRQPPPRRPIQEPPSSYYHQGQEPPPYMYPPARRAPRRAPPPQYPPRAPEPRQTYYPSPARSPPPPPQRAPRPRPRPISSREPPRPIESGARPERPRQVMEVETPAKRNRGSRKKGKKHGSAADVVEADSDSVAIDWEE